MASWLAPYTVWVPLAARLAALAKLSLAGGEVTRCRVKLPVSL